MRTDIEAVFTDFGGVLLQLEFERCFKEFSQLGAVGPNEVLFRSPEFITAMQNLEAGRIEKDVFFDFLRKILHIQTDNHRIEEAWNLLIGIVPIYKLQLLREIRKHYRLYMVSNTNAPHFDYTRQVLFRDEGLTVDDYFDKIYVSHEIHALKPNDDFYRKVIEDSKEDPSKSIFIDDLEANIQGAKRAGFHAYLIDPEEDLRKKMLKILA
ncbi:MAG: HAD family phosphatase [Porphyromonadaceae bacterium]|nr:HAD family phosphatase [Porphyromonadaceae bacterium]